MKRMLRLAVMLALVFSIVPLAQASDSECEQLCYDEYMQCAIGCPACDQCSCQLAYCRVSCGVPFTGC
jgi:hypothetical protein